MAVGIHGQLNKGASWGPAAQAARPGWGCGAPSCRPHYVGSPGAGVRAGELAAV